MCSHTQEVSKKFNQILLQYFILIRNDYNFNNNAKLNALSFYCILIL